MTTVPHQFEFPVKSGFAADLDGTLMRNFNALKAYLEAPHRTYLSRAIGNCYYADNLDDDAITVRPKGAGAFSGGQWDGVELEIDRPTRAFIWGEIEWENSDAADDYRLVFYLPVVTDGVPDNGVPVSHGLLHGSLRQVIPNIRQADIDTKEKVTVTFQWAVQNSTASNQDGTAHRRKMTVMLFDAPDASVTASFDPAWTRSAVNIAAYRNPEANEAN